MTLITLTPDEFVRLSRVVYDRTGIHLPQAKLTLLSNRLRKRLRALKMDSFEAYYSLISSEQGCEAELPHFLSAVTTNETYFFRNEQLWAFFQKELIPQLVARKAPHNRRLRIWSAASSSGEEAYGIAIALREHLPDFNLWSITIIGSDISNRVLEQARAGIYNDRAVSRLSRDQLDRWFVEQGGSYHLKDEIRQMVKFVFHNLRDDFPNGRFDLVFLRNVLMYFDIEMKKRVLEVVTNALTPGGFLIVGDVDPLRTAPEFSTSMTLVYKRPGLYEKPLTEGAVRQKELLHT